MSTALLERLEQVFLRKRPALAQKLRPGLPEKQIRGILQNARVAGEIDALLSLYTWKNGTSIDNQTPLGQTAFFPEHLYQFLDLEAAALEHFRTIQGAAETLAGYTGDPTGIKPGAGRYFPLFWDSATGYLAVDLKPSHRNRVVHIEFESEEPFQEAYPSFEQFLTDVLRANEEESSLGYFLDH